MVHGGLPHLRDQLDFNSGLSWFQAAPPYHGADEDGACGVQRRRAHDQPAGLERPLYSAAEAAAAARQGLTLVPISAQFELFRPPYDPTQLNDSCSI